MSDSEHLTKGQQLVREAEDLVADMQSDLQIFNQQTEVVGNSLLKDIEQLEKDTVVAEVAMVQIDAETIDKIGNAVSGALEGEGGEENKEELD